MGPPAQRPSLVPAPPPVGEIIGGKYQLEHVLGQGGMGVVYTARHLTLDQLVAIKFLKADSGFTAARARFLREARAAARLASDHVVRILDVDVTDDGAPYMVMERLNGTDLYGVLRARGPLPLGEVAGWLGQACLALAEAHAVGIVHRDLKPSNLFLARRSDGSTMVKVLDFGIAKVAEDGLDPQITQASGAVGSPAYMSPEQLRDSSSVDGRSDVWALGVILHELLSGHHPFEAANQAAVGARIACGRALPLTDHWPDAPPSVAAIVARAIAVDPADRFATVGELAEALEPFADPESRTGARIRAALTAGDATVVRVVEPSSVRTPTPAPEGPPSGVHSATDRFRRQHAGLAELAQEIVVELNVPAAELVAKAAHVRRMVARFSGKLTVHATMENDALYPRLLAHQDPAVRDKARALFDEIGTLYESFATYSTKWPNSASIEEDPTGFARDTFRVIKTLGRRMFREHEELYPLAEQA